VPPSVVRRARALLVQLEERSLGAQPQLDMFVSAPPPTASGDSADALREKLRSIDLDALSPREAHALLDELQRLAADQS
jgi:DNA mismatch repair protein MutS